MGLLPKTYTHPIIFFHIFVKTIIMKDYNSITFKNRAIDRLTVETTKPGKSAQELRRDEDYKKVSAAEYQKKQEEIKKQEQRLARRKGL